MNRVMGAAKRECGFVWLTVRIDGYRWQVGAARSGEWRTSFGGPETTDETEAARLANQWERDNADEAKRLFAEAEAFRESQ